MYIIISFELNTTFKSVLYQEKPTYFVILKIIYKNGTLYAALIYLCFQAKYGFPGCYSSIIKHFQMEVATIYEIPTLDIFHDLFL